MLVFDFFSGTGSGTKAFRREGIEVISVEMDSYFKAEERDILDLTASYLIDMYGEPDFIWASPPCTTFSVASISTHWTIDKTPKTDKAREAIKLVAFTIDLINELNPKYGYLIENPRGMLRKQEIVQDLRHRQITYCAYGDSRMKPTDLFGPGPHLWNPREACKNGNPCHESAPRGSRTGTQGIKGARARSVIPDSLSADLLNAIRREASI